MWGFVLMLLVSTLVGSSAAAAWGASPLNAAMALPGSFALVMQQSAGEYDGYYDSYYEPRADVPAVRDRGDRPLHDPTRDEAESYYEPKPPLLPDGANRPYRIYPQYYPRYDAMSRRYAE